jgi:integrase
MPTKMSNLGNQWQARVWTNGKQVASKLFPSGKKGGPEWRAAKEWEEQQKQNYIAEVKILTDSERLLQWGEQFLNETARRTSSKDLWEKKRIMQDFFKFCHDDRIESLVEITSAKAGKFLSNVFDVKGGNSANKYRTRLITAWNYGSSFVEGFPEISCPFKKVPAFPAKKRERYVPPDGDVEKVLNFVTKVQDVVMLMTFFFTGARAGEIFRLKWSDVDLEGSKIRLIDHKTKGGGRRERWLPLHLDLANALAWWKAEQPYKAETVFFQEENRTHYGEPFTHRHHFMPKLCKRAGVKPFGFHALRHKSAAIAFSAQGLNAAQMLMGHYRATTTDRYIRSSGQYIDHMSAVEALAGNRVGLALGDHFQEMVMPPEATTPEAFCKPTLVN